jgi:hypothetical protein
MIATLRLICDNEDGREVLPTPWSRPNPYRKGLAMKATPDTDPPLHLIAESDLILGERWLPVPGYEENYGVSDMGRVLSRRRTGAKGGLVKQSYASTGGYCLVGLSRQAKRKVAKVHHIVAAAFIGPRPDGMLVLHRDDDPKNPRLDNLRYGTHADNAHDRVANGIGASANTHCKYGHEYTEANTYRDPDTNWRSCVECRRQKSSRIYYADPVKSAEQKRASYLRKIEREGREELSKKRRQAYLANREVILEKARIAYQAKKRKAS